MTLKVQIRSESCQERSMACAACHALHDRLDFCLHDWLDFDHSVRCRSRAMPWSLIAITIACLTLGQSADAERIRGAPIIFESIAFSCKENTKAFLIRPLITRASLQKSLPHINHGSSVACKELQCCNLKFESLLEHIAVLF
jgi:hypothetical protein